MSFLSLFMMLLRICLFYLPIKYVKINKIIESRHIKALKFTLLPFTLVTTVFKFKYYFLINDILSNLC